MRDTRPGDLVVSYANAQIGHFGVVTGFPTSAPKPNFGRTGENWSDDGWHVPVAWSPVENAFRPKDYISELSSLLPDRYSPIQANGNGNQKAYLTQISPKLLDKLKAIGSFDPDLTVAEEWPALDGAFVERIEDQIQTDILENQNLSETESDALVKARKGQGVFRRNVTKLEPKCRVTGLEDKRLLVASHIKPWRACETAQERLDGSNGLLLAPHVDRLFDIGLISFEKNGDMRVSSTLGQQALDSLGLSHAVSRGVGSFSQAQERYLSFHRENVFLA